MKKIYLLLIAGLFISFFGCRKEISKPSVPVEENKVDGNKLGVFTLGGGTGVNVFYDATIDRYKANFSGAQLLFGAVPYNTDFTDKDIANVSMECSNCTSFTTAAGGRFVATISTVPVAEIDSIRSKLTKYSKAFQAFIGRDTVPGPGHQYVQSSLPNFPSISGTYSSTVSGVVVRMHSSPSTCVVYGEGFVPNPPLQDEVSGIHYLGSIPSASHQGVALDFSGSGGVINSVVADADPQITLTCSGTYTRHTDVNGAYKRMTVNIYLNGVLYDSFTSQRASNYPL